MERLASLRHLPLAEDTSSQESIVRPNHTDSTPDQFLRLWQNSESKAQLELPLIETRIKYLEKRHEKAKKVFNEKREKVIDHALCVAGYIGSIYVIQHLYTWHIRGQYFPSITKSLLNIVTWPWLHDRLTFEGVAIALPSFLAFKNATQAGINYYNLPQKPQEPKDLIDARQQKTQLLLTLQQSK